MVEATPRQAEQRGGSRERKGVLRPRAWSRQGRQWGGHGVAQSQLPAAGSWPKGDLFGTGRPGRHSKKV